MYYDPHLSVRVEGLRGRQVADALVGELGRAHHLHDVEAGPADVVAQHLDLWQMAEIRGGQVGNGSVCCGESEVCWAGASVFGCVTASLDVFLGKGMVGDVGYIGVCWGVSYVWLDIGMG